MARMRPGHARVCGDIYMLCTKHAVWAAEKSCVAVDPGSFHDPGHSVGQETHGDLLFLVAMSAHPSFLLVWSIYCSSERRLNHCIFFLRHVSNGTLSSVVYKTFSVRKLIELGVLVHTCDPTLLGG